MHVKISPSILSADFGNLASAAREAESAGADYLHLDIMDGHFVPNLTFGPDVVAAVRRATSLPLDVHLMIDRPEVMLGRFAEAGASILTVHQEACTHLHHVLSEIRRLGCRAGVAINPATPISSIEEVVSDVDLILVMTVNPGFGGQKTIPFTIDKARRVAGLMASSGSGAELEVDGGIGPENAHLLVEVGARVLVAGSSVFNSKGSVTANVRALRAAAEA